MKYLLITVSLCFLFSASLFADKGPFDNEINFTPVSVGQIVKLANKGIVDFYKQRTGKDDVKVKLTRHQLSTVRMETLKNVEGPVKTRALIEVGVFTDFIADEDSGIPDFCTVTLREDKRITSFEVHRVHCSPYD